MPTSVRQYREELYRLRTHPPTAGATADIAGDPRDSFGRVYLSAIPFLVAEYFVEAKSDFLPSGLVFPTGFLLFWAFYYTYYRPGMLENRLSELPNRWDLSAFPSLLIGLAIWFVKITLQEVLHLVAWVSPAPQVVKAKPKMHHHTNYYRRASTHQHTHSRPHRPQTPPPLNQQARTQTPGLPADIQEALFVLGIPKERDFQMIHKRYRELAKRYHPDLNHEVTASGREFMRIDSAYRKIVRVKAVYFKTK